MGIGYLKVEVYAANGAIPISGANVVVSGNDYGDVIYELVTNDNGLTDTVSLQAPDASHTLDPSDPGPHYYTCNVTVMAPGYNPLTVNGVLIFDGITSIQPINLTPANSLEKIGTPEIYTDPGNQLDNPSQREQSGPEESSDVPSPYTLREVLIPDYITVHLGTPDSNAENYRVHFAEYIKNVASHEIYPTWPEAAITANIYAQISYALNRVYTEWYPARGKNFNITNSTTVDQCFVKNGTIFQQISVIVDQIFNTYIRRQGRKEPFFAQYCNGTTSTCPGLSQWGTVTLANQGRTPIEILRYYYPDDVELVTSNNIAGIYESYPGTPLRTGSQGEDVRLMQNYLNRIRTNYPLIPLINPPDGKFGSQTADAVRVFQSTFNMTADGVIGKSTWYKISQIYTGIKNLADLQSEGERIGIGDTPPTSVIRRGSRGEDVVELQYILDVISEFYPQIPNLIQNGTFDAMTENAVIEFQRNFNLTPDGIVGPGTWNQLYSVYKSIDFGGGGGGTSPGNGTEYPGTPLRYGSTGDDVRLMQRYLNTIGQRYGTIPQQTVDGVFGTSMQNAVIAFQQTFGLAVDGVIGRNTWNAIVDAYDDSGTSQVYPGTLLRQGSRGDDVRLIQGYLNALRSTWPSIPAITADGIFGGNTDRAVREFQRLNGLSVDGIVGQSTWNAIINAYNAQSSGNGGGGTNPNPGAIYPGYPLRPGAQGEAVVQIQNNLNAARVNNPSIPAVTADGIYGENTRRAVVEFQRLNGLTQDGVVGQATWQLLEEAAANGGVSGPGSGVSYPGYPLRPGERGEAVRQIQNNLNIVRATNPSIPAVTADGIYGENTRRAVQEFQRIYGLTQDGVVGQATWNALADAANQTRSMQRLDAFDGTPLQNGAQGEAVKDVQSALVAISASYPSIPVIKPDGYYGEKTSEAVAAFQRIAGLTPDGIVGPKTWDALTQYYNEVNMIGQRQRTLSLLLSRMLLRRPF